jgi:hypothetical protein
MTRKKPSALVEKFYIDVSYPFREFDRHYGESRTNDFDQALEYLDEWEKSLNAEQRTAIIKLVEVGVKVHKVRVLCAGATLELREDSKKK